ncbi:MAG: ATP-binding protein [Deltaproteobacteria bacterium]|nr:ATP-binding protein [Deltaproteobacteria bacterium]
MVASEGIRAVCRVQCSRLRRSLERTLRAGGYDLDRAEIDSDIDVLFIDQDSRKKLGEEELATMMAPGGSVIILGESLEDDEIAKLLQRDGLNHLISEHQAPDEAELLVTTVKLASGDIFGVEKYLPWGAKVHEREITGYQDKSQTISEVVANAKKLGARMAVLARIEQVVDELLMNAMYDAPATRHGRTTAEQMQSVRDGKCDDVHLRYGCDGRYLVLSASDGFGELRKNDIFEHFERARRERTPRQEAGRGAGLGLHIVLSSVTRFIANIDPGVKTEVVCVFDLMQSGRTVESCAKSVHVFEGKRAA